MSGSTKGQIVLPIEIRRQDGIEPGEEFEIERGLVDWLLACPEKGYFVPVESESTDTLC